MEKAIYKGMEGVFIPKDEFIYIREAIQHNNILIDALIKEMAKDKPNSFDYLLNM